MKNIISNLFLCLLCMLSIPFFSSCSENEEHEPLVEGGGFKTKPGAVKMDINGKMQYIDTVALEIPVDSNYIDLTVYSLRGGLENHNLKVRDSSFMKVEVLPVSSEEKELIPEYYYGYPIRHIIRVSTLGQHDRQYINFSVLTWEGYTKFISEFMVVKKAK